MFCNSSHKHPRDPDGVTVKEIMTTKPSGSTRFRNTNSMADPLSLPVSFLVEFFQFLPCNVMRKHGLCCRLVSLSVCSSICHVGALYPDEIKHVSDTLQVDSSTAAVSRSSRCARPHHAGGYLRGNEMRGIDLCRNVLRVIMTQLNTQLHRNATVVI